MKPVDRFTLVKWMLALNIILNIVILMKLSS
jgi:hypothetical protein